MTKMSTPLRLRTLLGNYPNTAALKNRVIRSDVIDFDFVEYSPTNKGFKPMVREQAFDVSEMAIVTYMMAKSLGKPMVMLPAVVMARPQHPYALYLAERGRLTPKDLDGKRVGIRSFTTTTGAWIRGILQNDYDVDLNSIDWVSFEDSHVAEYSDPSTRAPAGKKILQMLLDRELDAVLGETSNDLKLKSLIEHPNTAAEEWSRLHGVYPVNHVVVVRSSLINERPDAVQEIYRMLKLAKESPNGRTNAETYLQFGVNQVRPALQLILQYAQQQKLLTKSLSVDELFAPGILDNKFE